MSNIQKRTDRSKNPWRARFRAPDGSEQSKSFRRKVDAERWLRGQTVKVDEGEWTDPNRSRVTFEEWSTDWLAGLIDLKPKTRHGYESLLHSVSYTHLRAHETDS